MEFGPVAVVTCISQNEQNLPRLNAPVVLIPAGEHGGQQKLSNAVVKSCGIF